MTSPSSNVDPLIPTEALSATCSQAQNTSQFSDSCFVTASPIKSSAAFDPQGNFSPTETPKPAHSRTGSPSRGSVGSPALSRRASNDGQLTLPFQIGDYAKARGGILHVQPTPALGGNVLGDESHGLCACLPLSALTDIYLGKQALIFSGHLRENGEKSYTDDGCSVSLRGRSVESQGGRVKGRSVWMHLQFSSPIHRADLVSVLVRVLAKDRRKVRVHKGLDGDDRHIDDLREDIAFYNKKRVLAMSIDTDQLNGPAGLPQKFQLNSLAASPEVQDGISDMNETIQGALHNRPRLRTSSCASSSSSASSSSESPADYLSMLEQLGTDTGSSFLSFSYLIPAMQDGTPFKLLMLDNFSTGGLNASVRVRGMNRLQLLVPDEFQPVGFQEYSMDIQNLESILVGQQADMEPPGLSGCCVTLVAWPEQAHRPVEKINQAGDTVYFQSPIRWTLAADSKTTLVGWLQGLNGVLNATGQKLKVAEGSPTMFLVLKRPLPPQPLNPIAPSSVLLHSLSQGRNGPIIPVPVVLSYDEVAIELRIVPESTSDVDISTLYFQKEFDVMDLKEVRVCLSSPPSNCFATSAKAKSTVMLIGGDSELFIEMKSEEELTGWLDQLNAALTEAGVEMEEAKDSLETINEEEDDVGCTRWVRLTMSDEEMEDSLGPLESRLRGEDSFTRMNTIYSRTKTRFNPEEASLVQHYFLYCSYTISLRG